MVFISDDFVEDVVAKLLVGVLTTAETELEADLVAMVQEAFRTGHFHIIVIGIRTDAELDFLKLDGSALVVFLELGLLVFVLAVINHAAYGRIGSSSHLDEVEALFFGKGDGIVTGDDPELFALGSDQPHLAGTDLLIAAHPVLRDVAAHPVVRRSYSSSLHV